MDYLGLHYIAEYHDCDMDVLNSVSEIEDILIEAARLSGATIVKPLFHQFSPHGVSGVVVIEESHFSIHTWPEYGFAAVDLFSCSKIDFNAALEHIRNGLSPDQFSVSLIERGTGVQENKNPVPPMMKELT